MAVFSYTAVDLAGRSASGTLLADTPVDGRQRLRDRGLRIVDFAPARVGRSWTRSGLRIGDRRNDQIAEIARYLSLLLRAGVPLAESLEVLTRGRNDKAAAVLEDVRDRVIRGESLGDAMAAHGDWFDTLFVSAVRVGELTGSLDESLLNLAEHLRARQTLRHQLTTALTYPVILVCVGTAVVIFLMSYVVPQLLSVLVASGRPLPSSTMLLKGLSDLLVDHWLLILLGTGALLVAGAAAYRRESVRRAWHRAQLRVPILGPLIQKSVVAQFAQQMSVLLKTGIPFVEAVRAVKELARNLVLTDELDAMARSVESGGDIAPTLERSRLFPPVVAHLVAVGQESGELTEMLDTLRSRYETEVSIATSRFTAALEPLLIVLLAAVVGFVVFACLMPMLEATRAIA